MKQKQLLTHLVHQYLYGYTLQDNVSNQIIEHLWKKMEKNNITANIENYLKKDIGFYNDISALIYIELAVKILTKENKSYDIDNIYALI